MPRTRSDRRHAAERAKAEAHRKLRQQHSWPRWDNITPRIVGIQAAMHNTCPCGMCTYKENRHARTLFTDLVKLHGAQ